MHTWLPIHVEIPAEHPLVYANYAWSKTPHNCKRHPQWLSDLSRSLVHSLMIVRHCNLRNWDRILVRAVKGLISRAAIVSICSLLWQRDVKLQQTKPTIANYMYMYQAYEQMNKVLPMALGAYEMKWWCFRRLLCTLFRLNWAKQTPGMRRN